MMKNYEIGVDLTFGTYLTVEANSLKEAKQIAKKQASDEYGPKGYHYVGVKTHSEGEAE